MTGLRRVGLTGNIASGKSVVAETWARLGAYIIDADVLARIAVEPGSDGLRKVVAHFGERVLDNGDLDRAALRQLVFDDDEERRVLESIVHPEVERLRHVEEQRARDAGENIVVHAIPLLFEVGLADRFDVIVLVDADERVRRERIMRTRGLGESEAQAMIDAQMPASLKRERADYVIDSNDTLADLEQTAERVWHEIGKRQT